TTADGADPEIELAQDEDNGPPDSQDAQPRGVVEDRLSVRPGQEDVRFCDREERKRTGECDQEAPALGDRLQQPPRRDASPKGARALLTSRLLFGDHGIPTVMTSTGGRQRATPGR